MSLVLFGVIYGAFMIALVNYTLDIYVKINDAEFKWIKNLAYKKWFKIFLYIISTILMVTLGIIVALGLAFLLYEPKKKSNNYSNQMK